MNKTLLILLFFSSLLHYDYAFSETRLKFTTFNIQWYGLGGEMMGVSEDEYRDDKINEFLKTYYSDSDVIAFQEIIDVTRFKEKVIKDLFHCESYEDQIRLHQHIVLCYKKTFTFLKFEDEQDYALDEVRLSPGQSRPGVHGVLKSTDGRIQVYVVALHLKAYDRDTEKRLKQITNLSKYLSEKVIDLPVVILGDMNAVKSDRTGLQKDDWEFMNDIFNDFNLGLIHIENDFNFTYVNYNFGAHLDHIWVSEQGFSTRSKAQVWEACNQVDPRARRFKRLSIYQRLVSDHCPVSVNLGL